MLIFGWVFLLVCWCAWLYPFAFRAPHKQNRPSITAIGPTRIGLLLETAAIIMALNIRLPSDQPLALGRLVPVLTLGPVAVAMAWAAVTHLGKQFRVHAGLYNDHELVTTGPYGIVRHPIYSSLLAMLICSALIATPWLWIAITVVIFIIGTEIRVRTEDGLLRSRFGEEFERYRKKVPAYIPFVR